MDTIISTDEILDFLWNEAGQDTFVLGGYMIQKVHQDKDGEWDIESIREDLNDFLMNVELDLADSI